MSKKTLSKDVNKLKFLYIFKNSYFGDYIFEVKRLGLPHNTPKDKVYSWYRVNLDTNSKGYNTSPTKLKFVDSGKLKSGKNIRILENCGKKNSYIFDGKKLSIDHSEMLWQKEEELPKIVIGNLLKHFKLE